MPLRDGDLDERPTSSETGERERRPRRRRRRRSTRRAAREEHGESEGGDRTEEELHGFGRDSADSDGGAYERAPWDLKRGASSPPGEPAPQVVASDSIAPDRIDQDALRVVSRLHRRGFEAYLVGGCVRDLMLGLEPKDFDVATAAHPRQVKRVFRNGRIIGRRFKLVHVVYGDHVIETATFRADPQPGRDEDQDLLIVDDNEFGTAAEDARRRDFTINGLFLDPVAGRILDFVGGLEDLERRVIRTIGDPSIRMAEDPVRILRAIKFSSRLSLEIDPETWAAMEALAAGLERSAPARLVEEILRLLRSGHSGAAFRQLHEVGALRYLVPELAEWLDWAEAGNDDPDLPFRVLDGLDQRTRRTGPPSVGLCVAALLAVPSERALEELRGERAVPEGEVLRAIGALLETLGTASRLSRRDLGHARRLLADQRRFRQASSKRFRPLLFMRGVDFEQTLELFHLMVEARDADWDLLERWQQRYREALDVADEEVETLRKTRRRRRRRRRSGGRGDSGATA